MTTSEKTRRTVTATIQAIATKKSGDHEYVTVTTQPRPGMKYPDNYNAWDVEIVKGFQTGDTVVLTLEQGKPRKDNPQKPEDYYQDLVGMAPATGQPQAAPAGTQGQSQPAPPASIKPYQDPRERSISRQVALKAAVEWAGCCLAKSGKEFTSAQITTVAQHFYVWLASEDGKAPKGEAQ